MANIDKAEAEHIIEEYNHRAQQYAGKEAVLDAGAGYRVNAYYDYISKQWIMHYLQPLQTDSILEFGCGMGRITSLLAPRVKHITGIDVSDSLLKQAIAENLPNASFYLIDKHLNAMSTAMFTKLLFNWVLIHINDDALHAYLDELENYITPQTMCYVFEQCHPAQRTQPTPIHTHRTVAEYEAIFKEHNWHCIKTARTWRMPSYGLGLWNTHTWLPEIALPLVVKLDKATLYRKPAYIEYTTEAFVFKRV